MNTVRKLATWAGPNAAQIFDYAVSNKAVVAAGGTVVWHPMHACMRGGLASLWHAHLDHHVADEAWAGPVRAARKQPTAALGCILRLRLKRRSCHAGRGSCMRMRGDLTSTDYVP